MTKKLSIGLSTLLALNMVATPLSAFAEEEIVQEQNIVQDVSTEKQDGLKKDEQLTSEKDESNDQQAEKNEELQTGKDEKSPPKVEQPNTSQAEENDELQKEGKLQLESMNIDYADFQVHDNGDGSASITGYCGIDTDLVIPDQIGGKDVTIIGKEAFAKKGITSVVLPAGLKRIEEAAFVDNKITELVLPEGIEYTGVASFNYNSISKLTIPKSLDIIDDFSFENNELTDILIPDSIDKIGMKAFGSNNINSFTINGDAKDIGSPNAGWIFDNKAGSSKKNRVDLVINGNVDSIGEFAFQSDTLRSVSIKGNVGSIGQLAFASTEASTSGIERVEIDGDIDTIGDFAFRYNKNLTNLVINGKVGEIKQYAFNSTKMDSLKIQGSINNLGVWALAHSEIKEVLLQSSVRNIDGYVFYESEMDSVTINGYVNNVADFAIYNSKIKDFRIKGTVDRIGEYALSEIVSDSITIEGSINEMDSFSIQQANIGDLRVDGVIGKIAETIAQGTVIENFYVDGAIISIANYGLQFSTIKNLTVQGFIDTIGDGAFQTSNIETMFVNGSVEEVGEQAFQTGNYGSITINGDVDNIGNEAFQASTIGLIDIKGDVGTIGKGAFYGKSNADDHISEISIEGDVGSIGINAFLGLNMSKGLFIGGNIRSIGEYAFLKSSIDSVSIKGNVGTIETMAFAYTEDSLMPWIAGVSNILIDGRVTNTGSDSFLKSNSNKIIIAKGIENIGDTSFMFANPKELDVFKDTKTVGASAFLSAKIPGGLTLPKSIVSIGDSSFSKSISDNLIINSPISIISKDAFHFFKTVKELVIPNTVVTISEGAFADVGLEKVKLSSNLESIEYNAFVNHNLACVTIPSTVTAIGEKAFKTTNIKPKDFVIYGDKASVAESYAATEGFTFIENNMFSNTCNPADWGIKVNYVDEQGNLLDSKTINKPAKGSYTENAKVIPGYTLKGDKAITVEVTSENPNHTITFVYTKNEQTKPPTTVLGTVTVKYIDDAGNVLETKTLKDLPLGSHTEQAKEISGYNVTGPKQQIVEITKENTQFTITFTYKKFNTDTSTTGPGQPGTTPPVTTPGTQEPSLPETPSKEVENHKGKRVIRDEGNGTYTTVPHYLDSNLQLKITTKYNYGLLITDRVAVPFKDIKNLFSYQEVEDLYNYLIVNGTTATTYSPYANISRGQFSAMIARALELRPSSTDYKFKDVAYYKKEVQALYEAGIITGFPDGSFGEQKPLSRQQAAAMIVRMLNHMGVKTKPTQAVALADMERICDYAKEPVKYLATQDVLISGNDTYFNPYNNLTRAQMAKVLMRSLRISDWY